MHCSVRIVDCPFECSRIFWGSITIFYIVNKIILNYFFSLSWAFYIHFSSSRDQIRFNHAIVCALFIFNVTWHDTQRTSQTLWHKTSLPVTRDLCTQHYAQFKNSPQSCSDARFYLSSPPVTHIQLLTPTVITSAFKRGVSPLFVPARVTLSVKRSDAARCL